MDNNAIKTLVNDLIRKSGAELSNYFRKLDKILIFYFIASSSSVSFKQKVNIVSTQQNENTVQFFFLLFINNFFN